MWNRIKRAFKKTATRRRSQAELDRLFEQNDRVFHDIGVSRADVARIRRKLRFV
jgi:uncharacterized protein YjiS (DUF1127 family)